jgi:hypothetical protein
MERNQTTEEIVQEIQKATEASLNAKPTMPFWLACKLIWFALRGKQVRRVQLHPPYKIEMG